MATSYCLGKEQKVMSKISNYFGIRIKMVWQRFRYQRSFLKFGKRSLIIRPDRIMGREYIAVGEYVRILHHLRIEAISQWREQIFSPKISIGDYVTMEQNCHIIAADELTIGNHVTISGNVFISDTEHEYEKLDTNIHQQNLKVKKVSIGDYCFIGYGAVIQAGTVLGKHCIVGSNAVVKGVYEDYSVIAGVPARVVKKYNPTTETWEKVCCQTEVKP